MSRLRLLPALILVAAVAACSSATAPSTSDIAAPAVLPAGVQSPAVIPSNATGPAPTCNPLASLRPRADQPLAMPAGSWMDTIRQRGKLIVGVDQNTYLFGYRNATSGQIEGFDIDIAKEVERAIFGTTDDAHIQLIAITSAQRIPFVTSGKVDLVAETMTMNCDRWRQVDFSSQYYQAGQKILVPKSSPVTSIDQLGGRKVCAATGSTSIATIAAAKSHPIPVAVPDWTDCLVMLQQGQVDAISTDDTILLGLAHQDPTTQVVGGAFTSEPYGMAISKQHPEFTRFVNAVLEQIRPQVWSQIHQKWLGTPDTPPVAQYKD
jgi:polar amino acid transport system substrate-binding protein